MEPSGGVGLDGLSDSVPEIGTDSIGTVTKSPSSRTPAITSRAEYQLLLRRPPEERTDAEVRAILELVQQQDATFILSLSSAVQEKVCRHLGLETFGKDERIFDYGDPGDKFYIILEGRVNIEVPRRPPGEDEPRPTSPDLVVAGKLSKGKAFGELALIENEKGRKARVTALEFTELLVLSEVDYRSCVGEMQTDFVRERVEFLRSTEGVVLEVVPDNDLKAMADNLRLEKYSGEEVLLLQGGMVDRVIFVKSGFCKVLRQINPRFATTFDLYSQRGGTPPNPFAPDTPENSDGDEDSPPYPKALGASYPVSHDMTGSACYRDAQPAKQPSSPRGGSDSEFSRSLDSRSFSSRSHRIRKKKHNHSHSTASCSTRASSKRSKDSISKMYEKSEELASTIQQQWGFRQAFQRLIEQHGENLTMSEEAEKKRSKEKEKAVQARMSNDAPTCMSEFDMSETVIVDRLHAGRVYGVMEMMECLVYQCSVVADPWAEVYVITKYDLIRHTSKAIVHALFRDYKARLSDERLIRRLKQHHRWNGYKRSLLDEIRNRKRRGDGSQMSRTEEFSRNNQASLSKKDYDRVGDGEVLWDEHAQTPPRSPYHKKYGMATDIFKVTCIRDPEEKSEKMGWSSHVSEDSKNSFGVYDMYSWSRPTGERSNQVDVKVDRETREATTVALDQKILRTIATQRYRKQFQQNKTGAVNSDSTKRLSIDALSQQNLKPEDSRESNVISARRQSAEPTAKGSGEREKSPPKTARQPMSARGKKGAAAQQSNEQTTERLEKKRLAYEKSLSLEERAKQAADDHLQKRANRVEEIRQGLKEKGNQSRASTMTRKSSKESMKSDADGSGTHPASKPTDMAKRARMSKARSFMRVSLHGRHPGLNPAAAAGKIQSGRDLPSDPILPAVDAKRGSKTRANS